MRFRKLLPPTYLYAAIILIIVLHVLMPGPQLISSPWRYFGILPVIMGSVLNLLADQAFKRYETTVKPLEESTCLVTDGVFRVSRNPMYLGFVLLLIGMVILLGSVIPWLVVISFSFLMENLFIQTEERMLEARFGNIWVEYTQRVRRWV